MVAINIKTDIPRVSARLSQLQKSIGDQALASAINKTLDQGRTQMGRQIASEYMVTYGYARERLLIRRAFGKGRSIRLSGELFASDRKGRSANLIAFVEKSATLAEAKRRNKAGTLGQLFVKIKRTGPKKAIPGAFIGNKGRTVFERISGTTMQSRAKYKGKKHAEQIKPMVTIDVAQMFNARRINGAITNLMRDRLPVIFEREAKFFVDKFNSRRG